MHPKLLNRLGSGDLEEGISPKAGEKISTPLPKATVLGYVFAKYYNGSVNIPNVERKGFTRRVSHARPAWGLCLNLLKNSISLKSLQEGLAPQLPDPTGSSLGIATLTIQPTALARPGNSSPGFSVSMLGVCQAGHPKVSSMIVHKSMIKIKYLQA